MKIEQLLVQYLYNNKHLYLQGLGSFRLADNIVLPAESDKDMVIPADAISFTYDTKIAEDDNLINFIVQQTRKIKPLASADLDSFILLGKQFLNIGKPFRLEGIGTLNKNQQNSYDFTPGQLILPRIEVANKPLKEKTEDDHISFETPPRTVMNKKPLLLAASVVVLGLLGWAGWYFWNKNQNSNTPATEKIVVASRDSAVTNTPAPPDTGKTVVPVVTAPPAAAPTGYTFRIVLKDYTTKEAAEKAYNRLTTYGHKLLLYPKDSTGFRVAMPFTTPLGDTLRVRDSLRKFFGGSPYIQLQ